MIKVRKDKIKIHGDITETTTDLAVIVASLRKRMREEHKIPPYDCDEILFRASMIGIEADKKTAGEEATS